MLRSIFNLDSPVMRFLSRLADLLLLNLLFILCSIPIVTIGASWTALQYVTLKIRADEDSYIAKSFFHSFKENFKQSTLIWLIYLAFGVILAVEFMAYFGIGGADAAAAAEAVEASSSGRTMKILTMVAAVLWLMMFFWTFILQSRFYNKIGQTLKNAALLLFGQAPRSIGMSLIAMAIIIVPLRLNNQIVLSYLPLYWIMFGFSLQAFINAVLTEPVVRSLMPEQKEEETAPDMEFTVDEDTPLESLGYANAPEKKTLEKNAEIDTDTETNAETSSMNDGSSADTEPSTAE